jgi:hypothetical protein
MLEYITEVRAVGTNIPLHTLSADMHCIGET